MKIKGFLAVLLLVVVIVYFLYLVKGKKQERIVEQVQRFSNVKKQITEANLTALQKTITAYIAGQGRAPENLQELRLFNPTLSGKLDEWGTPIKYVKLSDISFRLISAGEDRTFNTPDDIILDY